MNNPVNRKSRFAIAALLMLSLVYQAVPRTIANAATPVNRSSGKASKTARASKSFLPNPQPQPLFVGPVVTATKTDNRGPGPDPAMAQPGDTITYTVTISNAGPGDATGVSFIDTVDANTTLVASSGVLAQDDDYNTIGNVNINVNTAGTGLLANDKDITAGNNTGMTVVSYGASTGTEQGTINNSTPTAQGGSVTVTNANGTFTYDPPVGFTGTDTFKYKTSTTGGKTAIATARITTAGRIWFINNTAGACTSSCDGRLSHPFQTLAAFQALNDNGVALTHPKTGDSIFLYESATSYSGPVTLLGTQMLIGQDATASLISITGLTAPSGADPLPAMNTGAPATTIISASNGINLGSGNTLRGFTVGATTGTKISGTSFGTLTVGNSALPDVTLSGNGQALNLTTGAFAATSGFVSVASTSSGTQGINLGGITGTATFGSTTISGNTTQCILVGTTTANLNFGSTSCTGGTGLSFQNNSSGTRTFGSLTVTGSTSTGFIHGAGGGNVTVTGAANLDSAGDVISVTAPSGTDVINFQGATSATRTSAGGLGVSWTGVSGAAMQFNSLTIQTSTGTGLSASGGGTITVTNGTGTINNTAQAAAAIIANGITLNSNFAAIKSIGGTSGVSLTNVAGASTFGASSALSGASAATFLISGGTTAITYSGNLTQGNNAPLVSISGGHATGTVTFQTGTLSATNGTGLQFDNADSTYNFNGTNTLGGGDAGIDILNGSAGTFNFSSSSTITSPSGTAFNVGTSPTNPTVTYSGSITQNTSAQRVVNIDGTTGNTITFNTGTITGGASSTGVNINNVNGNVTFSNGMTMGTSGSRMTNQAVTINGGTGTYNLGVASIFTNNAQGLAATNADGTLNTSAGTVVDSSNSTAINIDGPAGLTTLGMTLTSVTSAGGTADGISIQDTSGTFTVNGDGSNTSVGGNATGGTISNKSGADNNNTQGVGVFLNNTTGITLRRMTISGTNQNFGIHGTTVSAFTMEYSTITGTNGTTAGLGQPESAVAFDVLTGSDAITSCIIEGGTEDNMRVTNTSGNLNRLTVTGSTFGFNSSANGNNSIQMEALNSGTVVNFTIQSSTIKGARADWINASSQSSSSMDAVIGGAGVGNNFDNTGGNLHPAAAPGGNRIVVSATANLTYKIQNNTLKGSRGSAIFVRSSGTAGGAEGVLNGRITGNTVGVAGTANSGSDSASGIDVEADGGGDHTSLVDSNSVFQYNNHGILFSFGDNTGGVGATARTMILQMTVTNNTVSNPGNINTNFNGIHLNNGTTSEGAGTADDDQFTTCYDAHTNHVNGAGQGAISPNNQDMRLRQRILTTVRLPGYGGANNDNTAVQNFEAAQNNTPGVPTVAAANTVSTGGGGFVGGATCTQPSLLSPPSELGLLKLAPFTPVRVTELTSITPVKVNRQSSFAAVTGDAVAEQIATAPATTSLATTNLLAELANSATTSEVGSQKASVRTQTAESSRQEAASSLQTPTQKPAVRDQKSQIGDLKSAVTDQKTTTNRANERKANHAVRVRTARPVTPMSGETVGPVAIGTLHAGDSVQITFQVTVNSPYSGGPNVSNQGTVSGSNFASVLTDDPDVVGSANPTLTPIQFSNLTINDIEVAEGAVGQRQAVFTVTVSPTSGSPISVHYQTADNTATAPGDYIAVPDTVLNIPANAPSATITVLVNGDTVRKANINFFVNLSNPTGAQITDGQGICTIHDDVPVLADFDGDGLTDVSVWSTDNYWRATKSSNGLQLTPVNWGAPPDIAVPGDYDGDGKTDIAIFRPSEGNWYVIKSSDSTVLVKGWGGSSDKPVPADYDGDGKTDFATFRPSDGNWYIFQSSNNTPRIQAWGASTDKLVPGDYDGDGKADLAVWRPSDGNWYIINSGGSGITIKQWGVSTDNVVPGDYDGDGKTDLAVWRSTTGNWYVVNSATNTITVRNWGISTSNDVAVPGDYDGDGRTDFAIFRPAEGNWYIINSSNTTVSVKYQAFTSGDLPLPKTYVNH